MMSSRLLISHQGPSLDYQPGTQPGLHGPHKVSPRNLSPTCANVPPAPPTPAPARPSPAQQALSTSAAHQAKPSEILISFSALLFPPHLLTLSYPQTMSCVKCPSVPVLLHPVSTELHLLLPSASTWSLSLQAPFKHELHSAASHISLGASPAALHSTPPVPMALLTLCCSVCHQW